MKPENNRYKIGNTHLPNPIVVASCPATEDKERLLSCADSGAAAAILKSCHAIGQAPQDRGFRRFNTTKRGLWGSSVKSRELMHPDEVCALLSDVGKETDMVVIPSIAGMTLDTSFWLNTIRYLEPFNPPCIQLDLFYLDIGLSLHKNQKLMQSLFRQLSQQSRIALIPKLNFDLRPGAASSMFNETGIAGWSLLDSLRVPIPTNQNCIPDDLPKFKYVNGLDTASLFGHWQLPVVMEYTKSLRKLSHLSIVAGGGVSSTSDVQHLLSLGADSVQVATAILTEGSGWIRRILADLKNTGVENGNNPIEVPVFTKACVQINHSRCTSCGKCAEQLMCSALQMHHGFPILAPSACDGCGFCADTCSNGAISLVANEQNEQHKVKGEE